MTKPKDLKRILLVDDDPATREVLSGHLSAAGYEPLAAENGCQAIEILRERRPRVVISDWVMPEMDGLELCRAIRSHQGDEFIYVIMLTVHADKARLMQAFDAGVNDFLSKPFHEGELLARIRAGARTVRLYDELSASATTLRRLNAELLEVNEKLKQMASTDELTGLLNRRQAMLRLAEQWAIAERYDQPLACAMIDVDHFKRINDNYGHNVGDEALCEIGAVLAASSRAADYVFRLGGEEFLVLLPNQTAGGAAAWAERCRALVESHVFICQDHVEPVTISVGLAERLKGMAGPDDLLKAADDALYAAKALGRNRAVVSTAD